MKIVSGIVSALISGAANANSIVQFGKFREKIEQKDKKNISDTDQDLFWNFNRTEVPGHIMDKLVGKSVRGHDVTGRKQARKFIQLKQMISFVLGDSWSSFDK